MCPKCGKCLSRSDKLIKHKLICKGTFKESTKTIQCDICEKHFASRDSFESHVKICKAQVRAIGVYKCKFCGKCLSRQDKLNNHMKICIDRDSDQEDSDEKHEYVGGHLMGHNIDEDYYDDEDIIEIDYGDRDYDYASNTEVIIPSREYEEEQAEMMVENVVSYGEDDDYGAENSEMISQEQPEDDQNEDQVCEDQDDNDYLVAESAEITPQILVNYDEGRGSIFPPFPPNFDEKANNVYERVLKG